MFGNFGSTIRHSVARVTPCFVLTLAIYPDLLGLSKRCHLGQAIIYDTVSELHWSVDIRTHGIQVVIEQILNTDWSDRIGKKGWWGRKSEGVVLESDSRSREGVQALFEDRVEVPAPKPIDDCVECYTWVFGDYMNDTTHKR